MSLNRMIFIVYVTATYDSYPDNQLVALRQSIWYYAFFIIFIFLNMFLYSSIPGSLIFNKFRSTRSKIILIDEIKQQHSMILAYVTLGEFDKNYKISSGKITRFLMFLYKNRLRYLDYVSEIYGIIDKNNNGVIVNKYIYLGSQLIYEHMHSLLRKLIDFATCFRRFSSLA
jgi:hypothetical protein